MAERKNAVCWGTSEEVKTEDTSEETKRQRRERLLQNGRNHPNYGKPTVWSAT